MTFLVMSAPLLYLFLLSFIEPIAGNVACNSTTGELRPSRSVERMMWMAPLVTLVFLIFIGLVMIGLKLKSMERHQREHMGQLEKAVNERNKDHSIAPRGSSQRRSSIFRLLYEAIRFSGNSVEGHSSTFPLPGSVYSTCRHTDLSQSGEHNRLKWTPPLPPRGIARQESSPDGAMVHLRRPPTSPNENKDARCRNGSVASRIKVSLSKHINRRLLKNQVRSNEGTGETQSTDASKCQPGVPPVYLRLFSIGTESKANSRESGGQDNSDSLQTSGESLPASRTSNDDRDLEEHRYTNCPFSTFGMNRRQAELPKVMETSDGEEHEVLSLGSDTSKYISQFQSQDNIQQTTGAVPIRSTIFHSENELARKSISLSL